MYVCISMCLYQCAGTSTAMSTALQDTVCDVAEVRRPTCHSLSLPFCVILGMSLNVSGYCKLRIEISWAKDYSLAKMIDQRSIL